MVDPQFIRGRTGVAYVEVRRAFLAAHMDEQGLTDAELARRAFKPGQQHRQLIWALRTGARKSCSPDTAIAITAALGLDNIGEIFIAKSTVIPKDKAA